jgi:MFS family permease
MPEQLRYVEVESAEGDVRPPPVLANRGFLLLWLAQLSSQTAQNAILFGLLVLVVDLTSSSIYTSVLVLSFVVPSFAFGVFSGVLVDRWSKRRILIFTNALRAAAAVAFLLGSDHVWALFAVSVAFATFSQFFTTTDAASIPFLVPRQQLMGANSMFSAAMTGSQFAGMVFLSPILLKSAGSDALFITTAVMFLVASGLARFLPPIGSEGHEESAWPGPAEVRGAVSDYLKALGTLRADPISYMALFHLTVSSSLVLLFAVLVPRYMQAILEVSPDNAVLVFAPVGVGALLGLRMLPWMAGRWGKTRTVAVGLLGVAICLTAFGLVETIAEVLERTEHLNPFGTQRVGGLSILMALTMAFAGPLGFAYAMVNAPAQTTLHERAPVEMRGRVFASQVVLANAVSIMPLMVVGGIADLYGVSPVILAIAMAMTILAGVSVLMEVRWRSGEVQRSSPVDEAAPVSGEGQSG